MGKQVCVYYILYALLIEKRCKYTYFSFSFFFFAAIKKMIIFVSSFVFYIKTVYIFMSVNMLEPSYVGLWMNTVWNAPLKSVQK